MAWVEEMTETAGLLSGEPVHTYARCRLHAV